MKYVFLFCCLFVCLLAVKSERQAMKEYCVGNRIYHDDSESFIMIYLVWLLLKANTPFDKKANELYKLYFVCVVFFFWCYLISCQKPIPNIIYSFHLRIICTVMENVIWYLILFVVNDVYDRKMKPI